MGLSFRSFHAGLQPEDSLRKIRLQQDLEKNVCQHNANDRRAERHEPSLAGDPPEKKEHQEEAGNHKAEDFEKEKISDKPEKENQKPQSGGTGESRFNFPVFPSAGKIQNGKNNQRGGDQFREKARPGGMEISKR